MRHRKGLMILVALLVGCDLPGRPDPARKFVAPDKVLDFTELYQKNCAGCHGKDGKWGPAPPLNDPVFLAIVPDEELTRVINLGRKGTSMPAFAKANGGTLTPEQVRALVTGMREQWENSTTKKADWPAYALPAEKGNAMRGKDVFARACAMCHGDDGTKDRPLHDSAYLALASEQRLRRMVITGRSDLGMPNCLDAEGPGRPMSPSDVNDVVAFMLSWKK